MTTRCKFYAAEVTQYPGDPVTHGVTLRAVTSGSDENKEFFRYTPSGELKLSSLKHQPCEVGKQYYLDITEAPA
jgi:hypothetical protein